MTKVAFFFGAGAEGKYNFNIRTGYDYLRSSLCAADELKDFDDALGSFFDNAKYFGDKFSYRKDKLDVSSFVLKNFIVQKASHDKPFFDKHENDILAILSDEEIRHVCDALGVNNPPKHISVTSSDKDIDDIKKEFKEILKGETKDFSKINSELLKEIFEKSDEDKIWFDLNIGIAGSLDSYFHTIIDPYKYGVIRFSKIFNYYWACYFTIIRDVLAFLSDSGYKAFDVYLTNDKKLDYLTVLKNINKLTDDLYDCDIKTIVPENSYYKLICDFLEEYKTEIQCSGVITTNYYCFCEVVSEKTSYLNGQLRLFEYPELLEVADFKCQKANKENIFFPFIFGQSLVKPIVHNEQINAFSEMKEILKETEILVILGFNVNEDDNHINTFLRDFAKREGKKLIYVTGKNSGVHKKLKFKIPVNSVKELKVTFEDNIESNKKIVEAIFDELKKGVSNENI